MASECVDRSGPRHNLTTVRGAPWDDVFLPSFYLDPLPVDDQRIATLHNYHVFVIIVDMFRRGRSLSTCPERHLCSVGSVEHITLHTWSGLTGSGNLVRGMPHEFRKLVHALELSHPPRPGTNSQDVGKRDTGSKVPVYSSVLRLAPSSSPIETKRTPCVTYLVHITTRDARSVQGAWAQLAEC